MPTNKQLLLALDMLTVGQNGLAVPQRLGAEAVAVQKENKSWINGKGIQGFGIGEKITGTQALQEVVLKIYVDRKLPEAKLKGTAVVPKTITLPSIGTTIATDVEAIGKVKLEANTTRVRPAIPGFSVGHPDITAGTFGCLVRKIGNQSTLFMLSNSHVLADEGLANPGDEILQPGPFDGGLSPVDVIGELSEFVPFVFDTGEFDNLVDAAIAKVRRADVTSVVRLIGVPTGVSTRLRRGLKVQKCGRTTDFTTGVVRDINYRLALNYKKPGGGSGSVGFRDQVLCTRYTDGGDSGSAVFNANRQVVGLHFAGSPSSSIFNPIQFVIDALGIEIVTDTI